MCELVKHKIAVLGGTGREGKGLSYRWLKSGHSIVIGSRNEEKAVNAANEIASILGEEFQQNISGMTNEQAAKAADIIVMTVPYAVHRAMCETIKPFVDGKIVIDVTVPLVPPKVTKVQMPEAGSASMEAQLIFGENIQVVAAFQNISYEHLLKDDDVNCDVLVCGNKKIARETVLQLVLDAGLVGWDAGPLANAVVVEGMTSILIGINKQFGTQSAGIKIIGVTP